MSEDFPKFVVMSGPEEGLEYTLPSQGYVKMGRAEDNDLVLSDNSVSRHHVVVSAKNESVLIRDEGSSNGTLLEGQKLTPKQDRPLSHLDELRLGIYELRFLTKPFDDQDLKEKKETAALRQKYQEPKAATPQLAEDVSNSQSEASLVKVQTPARAVNRRTKIFVGIGVGVLVLFALAFFFWQRSQQNKHIVPAWDEKAFQDNLPKVDQDKPSEIEVTPEAKTSETSSEKTPTEVKVESPKTVETVVAKPSQSEAKPSLNDGEFITVFFDVKSKPFAADIYINNERIGKTPLRKAMRINPKEPVDIFADFELTELHDIYRMQKTLKVSPLDDVVELDFTAELGELKVLRLPRHAEFYLEGHYAYDLTKEHPVKITRIRFGRPVYLPYGEYRIELKEEERIAGSENPVHTIKYQRRFEISKTQPEMRLEVLERDLKIFPVVIKSRPIGALVFANGEEVGKTPYSGELPLGQNQIKLKKDGFFDEVFDINMPMNSIFERTVELKTSKVGEFIQQAKEHLRFERDDEAIHVLVEALKYGGSDSEKSHVYYLLGSVYFKKNNLNLAESYFAKAEKHVIWQDRSRLALAQVWHRQGKSQQALLKLVEVLVSLDQEDPLSLKNEANAVFKKLSPVKSVIYIYTEPKGATLFLNDKPVSEKTPLMLSDLGLGNYRLQIEKPGYKTFNVKQSLKISEFVLIKVKLEKQNF